MNTKGVFIVLVSLVLAIWVRNWSKTSSVQGAPFTGVTPQRGIFGTDGTVVAGAM